MPAVEGIIMPISAQITNLRDVAAQIKKFANENVISTSVDGRKIESELSKVLRVLDQIEVKSKSAFKTNADFSSLQKETDQVEVSLDRIRGIFGKIKFENLRLPEETIGQINNLNDKIKDLSAGLKQFKEAQKIGLTKNSDFMGALNKSFGTSEAGKILAKDYDEIYKAIKNGMDKINGQLAAAQADFNDKSQLVKTSSNKSDYFAKQALDWLSEGFKQIDSKDAMTEQQKFLNKFLNFDEMTKQFTTFKGGGAGATKFWTEFATMFEIPPEQIAEIRKRITDAVKQAGGGVKASDILKEMGMDRNKGANLLTGGKDYGQVVAGADTYTDQAKGAKESGQVLDELRARYDAVRNAAAQFEASQSSVNSQAALLATAIKGPQTELAALQSSILQAVAAAPQLGSAFNQAGASMDQLKAKIASGQAQLASLGNVTSSLSGISNFVNRYVGIYAIFRKITTAIRNAFNNIKELDKTITNIAVVTNMSAQDLWGKVGQYTELGQQFGVATKDVYTVSQLFYQQGLQTSQVMSLTTETLKMAKIAGMDYADATNAMTVAVRAFKIEMDQAQQVTDTYSALAAKFAVSSAEIANAMEKTASSAANVGMTLQSTAAFISVMEQTTRESAENIGSALKSIISRYGEMKASPNTLLNVDGEKVAFNKVDTALKSIGISIKDAAGQFRDFDDVILELAKKWDTLDNNTQRYIATVMAGNRQQSRFIALVSNYDELNRAIKTANDAENASIVQVGKTMDSLETKTQQLKNAWSQLYLSLHVEDGLKGFYDFLTRILKTIGKLGMLKGGLPTLMNLVGFGTGTKKLIGMANNKVQSYYKNIQLGTDDAKNQLKQLEEDAKKPIDKKVNLIVDTSGVQAFQNVQVAQQNSAQAQMAMQLRLANPGMTADSAKQAIIEAQQKGMFKDPTQMRQFMEDKNINPDTEAGKNFSNLATQFDTLTGTIGQVDAAFKNLVGATNAETGAKEGETSATEGVTAAQEAQTPSIDNLGNAAADSAPSVDNLGNSSGNAVPQIENIGNASGNTVPQIENLGNTSSGAAPQIGNVGNASSGAVPIINENSGALQGNTGSLNENTNAERINTNSKLNGSMPGGGTGAGEAGKYSSKLINGIGIASAVGRIAGTAITAYGAQIQDKSTDEKEYSKVWTGVGNSVSGAATGASIGMVAGPWGALAGGIIGALAGLPAIIDGLEKTLAENIALQEAELKVIKDEALTKEAKTIDFQSLLDNLKKLKNTMYDSAEDMNNYLKATNELGDMYPSLISAYDEAGNAIIDIENAERALAAVRAESAKHTLNVAEKELGITIDSATALETLREEVKKASESPVHSATVGWGGDLTEKDTEVWQIKKEKGSNETIGVAGSVGFTETQGKATNATRSAPSTTTYTKGYKEQIKSVYEGIKNGSLTDTGITLLSEAFDEITFEEVKAIAEYLSKTAPTDNRHTEWKINGRGATQVYVVDNSIITRDEWKQYADAFQISRPTSTIEIPISKVNDVIDDYVTSDVFNKATTLGDIMPEYANRTALKLEELRVVNSHLDNMINQHNAKINNQKKLVDYNIALSNLQEYSSVSPFLTSQQIESLQTKNIYSKMFYGVLSQEAAERGYDDIYSWKNDSKGDFATSIDDLTNNFIEWYMNLSSSQQAMIESLDFTSYINPESIIKKIGIKKEDNEKVYNAIIEQFAESNKVNRDRILQTIYQYEGGENKWRINDDLTGLQMFTEQDKDRGLGANRAELIAYKFNTWKSADGTVIDQQSIISKYADYFTTQLVEIDQLAKDGLDAMADARLEALWALSYKLEGLSETAQNDLFGIITSINFSSYDSIINAAENIKKYGDDKGIDTSGIADELKKAANNLIFNVNTLAKSITEQVTKVAKEVDTILSTNKSGLSFDKAIEALADIQAIFSDENLGFNDIFEYDAILGKYIYTTKGQQKAIAAQEGKLTQLAEQKEKAMDLSTETSKTIKQLSGGTKLSKKHPLDFSSTNRIWLNGEEYLLPNAREAIHAIPWLLGYGHRGDEVPEEIQQLIKQMYAEDNGPKTADQIREYLEPYYKKSQQKIDSSFVDQIEDSQQKQLYQKWLKAFQDATDDEEETWGNFIEYIEKQVEEDNLSAREAQQMLDEFYNNKKNQLYSAIDWSKLALHADRTGSNTRSLYQLGAELGVFDLENEQWVEGFNGTWENVLDLYLKQLYALKDKNGKFILDNAGNYTFDATGWSNYQKAYMATFGEIQQSVADQVDNAVTQILAGKGEKLSEDTRNLISSNASLSSKIIWTTDGLLAGVLGAGDSYSEQVEAFVDSAIELYNASQDELGSIANQNKTYAKIMSKSFEGNKQIISTLTSGNKLDIDALSNQFTTYGMKLSDYYDADNNRWKAVSSVSKVTGKEKTTDFSKIFETDMFGNTRIKDWEAYKQMLADFKGVDISKLVDTPEYLDAYSTYVDGLIELDNQAENRIKSKWSKALSSFTKGTEINVSELSELAGLKGLEDTANADIKKIGDSLIFAQSVASKMAEYSALSDEELKSKGMTREDVAKNWKAATTYISQTQDAWTSIAGNISSLSADNIETLIGKGNLNAEDLEKEGFTKIGNNWVLSLTKYREKLIQAFGKNSYQELTPEQKKEVDKAYNTAQGAIITNITGLDWQKILDKSATSSEKSIFMDSLEANLESLGIEISDYVTDGVIDVNGLIAVIKSKDKELGEQLEQHINETIGMIYDEAMSNISSGIEYAAKGTTSFADMEKFTSEYNEVMGTGVNFQTLFSYDDDLKAYVLQSEKLSEYLQKKKQKMIADGIDENTAQAYIDNYLDQLFIQEMDVIGFLQSDNVSKDSNQYKVLKENWDTLNNVRKSLNKDFIEITFDDWLETIKTGGMTAVKNLEKLKGKENLSTEEITSAYRFEVENLSSIAEELSSVGEQSIISGPLYRMLQLLDADKLGWKFDDTDLPNGRAVVTAVGDVTAIYAKIFTFMAQSGEATAEDMATVFQYFVDESYSQQKAWTDISGNLMSLSSSDMVKLITKGGLNDDLKSGEWSKYFIQYGDSFILTLDGYYQYLVKSFNKSGDYDKLTPQQKQLVDDAYYNAYDTVLTKVTGLEWEKILGGTATEAELNTFVSELTNIMKFLGIDDKTIASYFEDGQVNISGILEGITEFYPELGKALTDSIGNIFDKIYDEGLESITKATELATKGTNKRSEMDEFTKNYLKLLPNAKVDDGIDTDEIFEYDSLLEAYTIKPEYLKNYVDAQKARLKELGLNDDIINNYIEGYVQSTLANEIDILGFVSKTDLTDDKNYRILKKQYDALQAVLPETSKLASKEFNEWINEFLQGGTEAIKLLQELKGKANVSTEDAINAYKNKITRFQNMSSQLAELSVGSLVEGPLAEILKAAQAQGNLGWRVSGTGQDGLVKVEELGNVGAIYQYIYQNLVNAGASLNEQIDAWQKAQEAFSETWTTWTDVGSKLTSLDTATIAKLAKTNILKVADLTKEDSGFTKIGDSYIMTLEQYKKYLIQAVSDGQQTEYGKLNEDQRALVDQIINDSLSGLLNNISKLDWNKLFDGTATIMDQQAIIDELQLTLGALGMSINTYFNDGMLNVNQLISDLRKRGDDYSIELANTLEKQWVNSTASLYDTSLQEIQKGLEMGISGTNNASDMIKFSQRYKELIPGTTLDVNSLFEYNEILDAYTIKPEYLKIYIEKQKEFLISKGMTKEAAVRYVNDQIQNTIVKDFNVLDFLQTGNFSQNSKAFQTLKMQFEYLRVAGLTLETDINNWLTKIIDGGTTAVRELIKIKGADNVSVEDTKAIYKSQINSFIDAANQLGNIQEDMIISGALIPLIQAQEKSAGWKIEEQGNGTAIVKAVGNNIEEMYQVIYASLKNMEGITQKELAQVWSQLQGLGTKKFSTLTGISENLSSLSAENLSSLIEQGLYDPLTDSLMKVGDVYIMTISQYENKLKEAAEKDGQGNITPAAQAQIDSALYKAKQSIFNSIFNLPWDKIISGTANKADEMQFLNNLMPQLKALGIEDSTLTEIFSGQNINFTFLKENLKTLLPDFANEIDNKFNEIINQTRDQTINSLQEGFNLATQGTTNFSDMEKFVADYNRVVTGADETIDSLFSYNKMLKTYVLDNNKLSNYVNASRDSLIKEGVSPQAITRILLNQYDSLFESMNVVGWLQSADMSMDSSTTKTFMAQLYQWASIFQKDAQEEVIGAVLTNLFKGGQDAVAQLKQLKRENITAEDIKNVYRIQVTKSQDAMNQLANLSINSVVDGSLATVLKNSEDWKNRITDLGNGSVVINSMGDVAAVYDSIYAAMAQSGEATKQDLVEAWKTVQTEKTKSKTTWAGIAKDISGLSFDTITKLVEDGGLSIEDANELFIKIGDTYILDLAKYKEKLKEVFGDDTDSINRAYNEAEATLINNITSLSWDKIISGEATEIESQQFVEDLQKNLSAIGIDLSKFFTNGVLDLERLKAQLGIAIGKGLISEESANLILNNITEIYASVADTIFGELNTSFDLLLKGTTNYADIEEFVQQYNKLVESQKPMTATDLFDYDELTKTFTLTTEALNNYKEAEKQRLIKLGISEEYITKYFDSRAQELIGADMDITDFISGNDISVTSKSAKTLVSQIRNWYILTGKAINDAELNIIMHQLLNGGDQAVKLLKQFKGEDNVSSDEIEAAYKARVNRLQTAAEQLTDLTVGSIINGDLINILNNSVDGFKVKSLGDGTGVITAIGNMADAYNAIYKAMKDTAESTTRELNSAFAKVLTAIDQGNIDAIQALNDAMGMDYETLGNLLAEYAKSPEWANLEHAMHYQAELGIESLGNGKIRIYDFEKFASHMNWEVGGEAYMEAYNAYNDSLIDLGRKTKENIINEVKNLSEAKTGDKINFTYIQEALGMTDQAINNLLQGTGARIEKGILTIENGAKIPDVINKIVSQQEIKSQLISSELAELADAVSEYINNIISLINNAIDGTLSNSDANTLKEWASGYGIDLSFTQTAEGLRISNAEAIKLYTTLKSVDNIKASQVFDKLRESLENSSDDYKTVIDLTKHIEELSQKISEADDKVSDARLNQYKAELEVAKEILAVRTTQEDESWNFMSNKIPGPLNNPLNYWENWGTAVTTLRDAFKKGTEKDSSYGMIDFEDWYNIANAVNDVAKMTGQEVKLGALTFKGDMESASAAIEAGANALTGIDTGEVKVNLASVGIGISSGADAMGQGIDSGVKEVAKSQVKALDAIIAIVELIVQMEALGDIDIDGNGIDIGELFTVTYNEETGKYEQSFVDSYEKWRKNMIEQLNLKEGDKGFNKDLQAALKGIKIGEFSLADIITWDANKLMGADESVKKAYSAILTAFSEAAKSGDYDLDNIQQSVLNILKETGFEGQVVIDIGDMTYVITGSSMIAIDWESADNQAILKEIAKGYKNDMKLAQQKASEYISKLGTSELEPQEVNYALALMGKVKLKGNKITSIEIGGKTVEVGSGEQAQTNAAAAVLLEQSGFKIDPNTDFTIETNTPLVGKMHIGKAEIEGVVEKGVVKYKWEGQEATSLSELYKKVYLARNPGKKEDKVTEEEVNAFMYVTYGIKISGAVKLKNPTTGETFTMDNVDDATFNKINELAKASVAGNLEKAIASDDTITISKKEGVDNIWVVDIDGKQLEFEAKNEQEAQAEFEKWLQEWTDDLTGGRKAKAQAVVQAQAIFEDENIVSSLTSTIAAGVSQGFSTGLTNALSGGTVSGTISKIEIAIDESTIWALAEGEAATTPDIGEIPEAKATAKSIVVTGTDMKIDPSADIITIPELKITADAEAINSALDELQNQDRTIRINIDGDATKFQQDIQGNRQYATINGANQPIYGSPNEVPDVINYNKKYASDHPAEQPVKAKGSGLKGGGGAAKGTIGNALAGGATLMGELGPEMVVSGGRYFVVGQNGAEFVNLDPDAIVFNHLQTQRLLNTGHGGRGRPITNERTATAFAKGNTSGGPAMASASAALAALKALRALWQNLADKGISDMAKQAGGGGGGGGGGDKDNGGFIKDLELWYTLVRQIAILEKEITYQQTLRSKLESDRNANGYAYYQSQKKEIELLKDEIQKKSELVNLQKSYYESQRKYLEQSSYGKIFTFDEKGTMIMDKDSILGAGTQYEVRGGWFNLLDLYSRNKNGSPKYTAKEQYDRLVAWGFGEDMKYDESGKEIDLSKEENYVNAVKAVEAKMDSIKENMQGWYDDYLDGQEDIVSKMNDLNEAMQSIIDNQISVENRIEKAIEDQRQRAIDDAKAEKDAIQNSSEDFIQGLTDSLEAERKMYETNQSNNELNRLRRQLSILQRSGGSASEIRSLQKDIASREKDQYFDAQQNQIDAIQKASEAELERLDKQIELMETTLKYQQEHGLLWAEVSTIMAQNPEEIENFLLENSKDLESKSTLQISEDLRQIRFEIEQWVGYRDDLENPIEEARSGYWDTYFKGIEELFPAQAKDEKIVEKARAAYNAAYAATSGDEQAAMRAADEVFMEYVAKAKLFKSGGLADYTGLAMVHGSRTDPEAFLNAEETHMWRDKILSGNNGSLTSMLIEFEDMVSGLVDSDSYSEIGMRGSGINIEQATVNMNATISNDYDARRAADTVMEEMVRIARKTTAQQARR